MAMIYLHGGPHDGETRDIPEHWTSYTVGLPRSPIIPMRPYAGHWPVMHTGTYTYDISLQWNPDPKVRVFSWAGSP